MQLSNEQKTELRQRGVLKLPGLVPECCYAPVRDAVRTRMAKQGLWDGARWQLDSTPCLAWPRSGPFKKVLRKMKVAGHLVTPELRGIVVDLFGPDASGLFKTYTDQPQILFSLPHGREWFLPYTGWHLDVPGIAGVDEPGYQMFTFLEPVVAGQAGTLVAAGSHRFVTPRVGILRSKNVKRILKRHEVFRRLMSSDGADRMQLMADETEVDGVPVQVRELTGKPGDVWLMDMRSLHTIAPNAADKPRVMVTERFVQPEAYERMMAVYRKRAEPGLLRT